jgi:anthranilate phosphoribosyltransferase
LIREAIQKLVNHLDLTYQEARESMLEIMSGYVSDAQISSFLIALRMKGETIEEISAFATVMKELCQNINPRVLGRLVDTCGTGGDRVNSFNISTTSTFVVAGAGVNIAKHGNRSVSSSSGSADAIQELGVEINLTPETVEKIIEKIGMGFMYAPLFHPAMKYAIGPRRELGIRTVFNILGPLTNPANAKAQLLGVYDPKLTEPLAGSLRNLGCEEAMVVHGMDGLDEISTIGRTRISWLKNEEINTFEMSPKELGVKLARSEDIRGYGPEKNAELIFKILNGYQGMDDPKTEIVLVNGVAGIIVSGKAEDFGYGMELALESIESGSAYNMLRALVRESSGDLSKLERFEEIYE